jgi:dsDNA-specific endonuclease/ATPase MutS2
MSEPDGDDAVSVPLTDSLDLHTFSPRDVPELVAHYLDECAAQGFAEVRVIHGKGTGTLRKTVQSILKQHTAVASFETAPESRGGWGATLVRLVRARP